MSRSRINDADCDSDDSGSTLDWTSNGQKAAQLDRPRETQRRRSASAADSSTARPAAATNHSDNAEAGPSRIPHENTGQPKSHGDASMAESAEFSSFSPSILPKAKICGSDMLIEDVFHPAALAEIDDEDLFRELPFLGPPVEPNQQPYWGISTEQFRLLSDTSSEQPPMPVSPIVQANLERFHELKKQGIHFNENLMGNRSFKNPHVYSQLVEFLDIDETRSNLPFLDTGRAADGGWRSGFPLSEEQLIAGDPIAMLEKQQQDHVDKQMQKLKAGSRRTIDFSRAKQEDHVSDAAQPSWEDQPSSGADGVKQSSSSKNRISHSAHSKRRSEAADSHRSSKRRDQSRRR